MEVSTPRADTLNKLRFAADSAFAMLAGMQLDVFTPFTLAGRLGLVTAHKPNSCGVSEMR